MGYLNKHMLNKFLITLCNPNNFGDEYILEFGLTNSSIAKKWHLKVIEAIDRGYSIDDPERFYGLNTFEKDELIAIERINKCIDIINSHKKIINRRLTDIHDTDTLNYLHHIFEEYHGLLDQQTNEFYTGASAEVRKALSDLNIGVHRVENVLYGNPKRFVTTYFGLPKTDKLTSEDFDYMTCQYNFGGLYLNYVEVGKTLADLVRDKDEYIDDDAFKPWNYYSADFTVRLYDRPLEASQKEERDCLQYYTENQDFFRNLGYPQYTNQLKPGFIKLGDLLYDDKETVIKNITKHQYVKNVTFV
jgi:hypothetical protein